MNHFGFEFVDDFANFIGSLIRNQKRFYDSIHSYQVGLIFVYQRVALYPLYCLQSTLLFNQLFRFHQLKLSWIFKLSIIHRKVLECVLVDREPAEYFIVENNLSDVRDE